MSSESYKNVVILQDVNRANPCEFPKGVSDTAVIENPCNKDEILIFGGYRSNDIYIYNKSTNTMKKNKVSIEMEKGKRIKVHLVSSVHVISGNRKNSVIVLWTPHSCYRVFDCEKMDFDGDTIYRSVFDRASMMGMKGVSLPEGSTIERWNNFLFIFRRDTLAVYDIKDECPCPIKCFDLSPLFSNRVVNGIDPFNRSRKYHRSLLIESKTENKNKVMLKFLLFGGLCERSFNNSFYQIDVKINMDSKNNNDNYKFDIDFDKNVKNMWKIPQNIAEKYNYNSKLTYTSAHWYNSQYLIIVGGYHDSQKKASDEIICFDYKKKKWYVGDEQDKIPMYKMPKALFGQTSLLQRENNRLYLYVFGGCTGANYIATQSKTCIKLKLTTQMDWKIERIIWIGYMKNDKNANACQFANIPKDVVRIVLSFLQPRFIFE